MGDSEARWWYGEGWRWNPDRHHRRANPSISIIEPTLDDAIAAKERDERKHEDGAERARFGFSRVLGPPELPETRRWEGDDS